MALALDTPNSNLTAPPGADSPTANLASMIGGQQQGAMGQDRKQAVQKVFTDLQTAAQTISRMEPGIAPEMRELIDASMKAYAKFVGTMNETEPGGSQPYM